MKISYLIFAINIFLILYMTIIDVEFLLKYRLYRYDAYVHFFMYMMFSFLSIKIIYDNKSKKLLYLVFVFPFITEYVQHFLPTRSADIKDLFNNYYGLISGIILFIIFKYVKKAKYIKSCNN